jgi:hypothetical protein
LQVRREAAAAIGSERVDGVARDRMLARSLGANGGLPEQTPTSWDRRLNQEGSGLRPIDGYAYDLARCPQARPIAPRLPHDRRHPGPAIRHVTAERGGWYRSMPNSSEAHDQPPSCRDHPNPSCREANLLIAQFMRGLRRRRIVVINSSRSGSRALSPPEVADAVPIGGSKRSKGYAHYTTVVWNQSSAWPGAVVGCWVDITHFCALRSERCRPA